MSAGGSRPRVQSTDELNSTQFKKLLPEMKTSGEKVAFYVQDRELCSSLHPGLVHLPPPPSEAN